MGDNNVHVSLNNKEMVGLVECCKYRQEMKDSLVDCGEFHEEYVDMDDIGETEIPSTIRLHKGHIHLTPSLGYIALQTFCLFDDITTMIDTE